MSEQAQEEPNVAGEIVSALREDAERYAYWKGINDRAEERGDKLVALLDRIAAALEEANRWTYSESPDGDTYKTCTGCAKTWQANATGWLECAKSHPGCPRCLGEEAKP